MVKETSDFGTFGAVACPVTPIPDGQILCKGSRKDIVIVSLPARRLASALAVVLSLSLASPLAAADLFLNDEPEVYAAVDKLSALGYLPRLLANTRPYSLRAVRTALQGPRTAAPKGFDRELLRWLAGYVAPGQMGRMTGAVAHSDSRFTPGNSQGIPVPKGWSGRASITAREETTPLVNGQVRFTSFYGEGGDDGHRLLDASLEVGYPWFAIQAGKLSTWYGSGRHGALTFTNNAAPYLGVRVHNPEPVRAPGLFSSFGLLQYDVFVARMEGKEHFSHSLLVGTRLAARPRRLLEVGFSRALHYDGDGRSNDLSEFLDGYFGNNESSGESNPLSAFDITLTLPFAFQPVQVYWERGVDDNSHLGEMFVPWSDVGANILGLYFPRILGSSRLDLRVEYADTFSGDAKDDNWYGHPAYPHQYRGQILGHPMGGSARSWFIDSRYYLRPDSFAGVSYERVMHDGSDLMGERREVVSAGLTGWFSKKWRGEIRASWDHVSDEGGIPGRDGSDVFVYVALSWQTDTLLPPDEEVVPVREYRRMAQ